MVIHSTTETDFMELLDNGQYALIIPEPKQVSDETENNEFYVSCPCSDCVGVITHQQ